MGQRPELTKRINDFTDWLIGGVDTYTIWIKDHVTQWVIDPLQDLMAAVAVVGDGAGAAVASPTCSAAGVRRRSPPCARA